MQTTHQIITKYIDEAIEKSVEKAATKAAKEATTSIKKEFEEMYEKSMEDIKRHNAALAGHFDHTAKTIAEIANARTTTEEVKGIIRQENKNLYSSIEIIKNEISSINKKLA